MAAKEVTCQVRYMTDNANTINKNYSGLKSTITNDQIKALAQFFNQLTDDEVIVAYKISKEEIQIADWGESSGRFEISSGQNRYDDADNNSSGRKGKHNESS